MRVSKRFKREVVDYRFSHPEKNLAEVSAKYGIAQTTIAAWCRKDERYEEFAASTRVSVKHDAIEYSREHPDEKIKSVAERFGVSCGTLNEWRKEAGLTTPRGAVRRWSPELRKKVCDLYFEKKHEGMTISRAARECGVSEDRAKYAQYWVARDPRYEAFVASRTYSDEEKAAAIDWYYETPGVTSADVLDRFGYPHSRRTFQEWIAASGKSKDCAGYSDEHKIRACELLLANPGMTKKEAMERLGYPKTTGPLNKWLDEFCGIPRKRANRVERERVDRAVDDFLARPGDTIESVALGHGLTRGVLTKAVEQDPRWKDDPRSPAYRERLKPKVVDFYFENPHLWPKQVAAHFDSQVSPALVTRWASEDPRFLDPATYGCTEEQKDAVLNLRFEQPGLEPQKMEKILGFPIPRRGYRCWVFADPRNAENVRKANVARKRRYGIETRAAAVLEVCGGRPITDVAKEYNIVFSSVSEWVDAYRKGGLIALARRDELPGPLKTKDPGPMPKRDEYMSTEAYAEALVAYGEALQERNRELTLAYDVSRATFDVIKKDPGLSMEKPLKNREKVAIINRLRPKYKLKELLRALGISKSSYEYGNAALRKPDKYAEARVALRDGFEKSGHAYGYRRLRALLRLPKSEEDGRGIVGYGIDIDEKVVRRLMADEGITPYPAKKIQKYNSFRGKVGKIAPNVIKRDFRSDAPYRKLLTDITEFHLNNYKIYLSPVVDCFNGEVISWTVSQSPNMELVNNMLKQAVGRVGRGFGVVIHSDQGWQYQHAAYRQLVIDAGWTQSMSRKGCCSDNSAMEGFFGRLKNEFFYNHDFAGYSPEEFMGALSDWIVWHNERRIKETLGYTSPVLYREQWEREHPRLALAA